MSIQPGLSLVHTKLAGVASHPRKSPLKRLLVTLLILGTVTTAVGAGTFASYNASTRNAASTFATDASETATNSNTLCGTALSVTGQRPGDQTMVTMNLQNKGNVNGTLNVYGGACNPANTTDQSFFHGTGTISNVCSNLQFYVQQTSPSTVCKYGQGASGEIHGTAITFPLTITNGTNDRFSLTVDGAAHTDLDFRASTITYANTATDMAALATDINGAISTWGTAAVGPDSILYISSKTIGASSTVSIAAPTSQSAISSLGMSSVTTANGGQSTCVGFDPVHTISDFVGTYGTSTSTLGLSALNSTITNTYTLAFQLQTAADNQLQGRKATFDLTWLLQ
ncbi:MAG: hypothetical protein JF603_16010 [Acidobacteria bacterium]|nr:hypothetical protein [Acidobacteriota bacterium]